MESWVDIKKENQIMRVPYQAFKDRFEHDGFSLVIDESLNESPAFSVIQDDADKETSAKQTTINKEQETKGGTTNGAKQRTRNKSSGKK